MIAVCKYCNQTKQTRFGVCIECCSAYTLNQTKPCNKCNLLQSWARFNKSKYGFLQLKSECKTCESRYNAEKRATKEYFLKRMLGACKHNNNLRNKKKPERELKFTWTYEQMLAQLEKQKDRCAISGVELRFGPHHDWQCSPERIDNNAGYVEGNMMFICLEFQTGHVQSSCGLVNFICTIETKPHPRLAEISAGVFSEIESVLHCDLGTNHCQQCRAIYNRTYRNTVNGRLQTLVSNAKNDTKKRNASGRGHAKPEIDTKILLNILQKQEGRCYYSGHHLSFESATFNCVSLERIDVNLGYISSNCCLIMQVLNTVDNSSSRSMANLPKHGSGGWTHRKIAFLRSLRKTIINDAETMTEKKNSIALDHAGSF